MQDSVRDLFMVALKRLGYSMNSTNESELQEAKELLIAQKPLVQAYVIDQVRDKMIGDEAAIGVIYSGEAIYTQRENPNLAYVIPEEGTNIWIDSWVIPKNAENKENAEKFIDFMCRGDIALMNFEFITYSTPNTAARDLIEDDDIRNSEIAFPDLSKYDNLETGRRSRYAVQRFVERNQILYLLLKLFIDYTGNAAGAYWDSGGIFEHTIYLFFNTSLMALITCSGS